MDLRDRILSEIVSTDRISRRELSRRLSLDIRTVSRYTDALLCQGFVGRHLVSLPMGRPVYEYYPDMGKKFFAVVMPGRSGIYGLVRDDTGVVRGEVSIAEFSIDAEIPHTASRKIRVVFDLLSKRCGSMLHGASLLFSRTERYLPFAREVSSMLSEQLSFPLFVDSPISVQAFAFAQAHRNFRKFLFLHFGYALELALFEDDELSPDNEQLSLDFNRMQVGNEILWHVVSLSNIYDRVAALKGDLFYDEEKIRQRMIERDASVMNIFSQKETIILKAIKTMAEQVNPEAVVVLALPGDLHTLAMPKISAGGKIRLTDGRQIPYYFERSADSSRQGMLALAADTAGYRCWKRFFKTQ